MTYPGTQAHWIIAQDGEPELKALYDRHYSARHYKDGRRHVLFVGPGEKMILTTPTRNALWIWRKFKDDSGQIGINCAMFRNESGERSSDLIREADAIADFCWPGERHYTYIRPEAVRSANPGYCYLCAGWKRCGYTKAGLYGQWASMQTVRDHYAEYDLGRLRMIQERIGGAK